MKRIAIISPSGKLYGSEQVLLDFLSTTRNLYHVYLPMGEFFDKLRIQNIHFLHLYSSVRLLYVKLFFLLLLNKYDGIYINEGGHVKYLNILAILFPYKHFFVHIRLVEDSDSKRLGKKHSNISYVSISEYITRVVLQNANIECKTIYDIYKPISGFDGIRNIKLINNLCRLGIVGRVTPTKGLYDISQFCEYCEKHIGSLFFELHFYGGIDSHIPEVQNFIKQSEFFRNIKCIFHGFVNQKQLIYSNIDILVHFNKAEPLGRILMEALDFGIPFVGYNLGGVGEMAYHFGVFHYMIPYQDNWQQILQERIVTMIMQSEKTVKDYQVAKEKMKEICCPENYTYALEHLFYE